VNNADVHIYAIDSFSSDRKAVRGPSDMPEPDALAYLAQRLSDQHRGCLSTAYWRARARGILDEARRRSGAACTHRTARGRGLIVTALRLEAAALFEVAVLPQFDDFEGIGEQFAAVEHPSLAAAMREAGRQAEAWVQMDSEKVRREQDRGPLVGFEFDVSARLASPLLAGGAAERMGPADEPTPHAPRRGCSGRRTGPQPSLPAA
jgi:hypothetical protein